MLYFIDAEIVVSVWLDKIENTSIFWQRRMLERCVQIMPENQTHPIRFPYESSASVIQPIVLFRDYSFENFLFPLSSHFQCMGIVVRINICVSIYMVEFANSSQRMWTNSFDNCRTAFLLLWNVFEIHPLRPRTCEMINNNEMVSSLGLSLRAYNTMWVLYNNSVHGKNWKRVIVTTTSP